MKQLLAFFLLLAAVFGSGGAEAAGTGLTDKQESLVTIAALSARGDLPRLREALFDGLDRGMTVNEEKEVLLQLYAYAGFPRSLNGLQTLQSVAEERRAAGKQDETGREASPADPSRDRRAIGEASQTALVGHPVRGGVYDFAPEANVFLQEHLFCAIFERDVLTWRERELATVSMLAGIGNVNAQLRSHMRAAMRTGVTAEELRALTEVLRKNVGADAADNAGAVLADVLRA